MEKAANEQRIHELEAQVAGLQDDLKKSQEQEKKALAVADNAIKAAQAPAAKVNPDSSNSSLTRAQRAAVTKEQQAKEKAAKERMDALEKENAEMRGRCDDVVRSQRQADAARKSAEKQVEEQSKRIAQLEAELRDKAARSPSPKQAMTETQRTEPIAATAAATGAAPVNDTGALEERIKELERLLKLEREARLAAEKQVAELQKRAAAAEAETEKAKAAAAKAEAKYASAGAGAESRPKKTKTGCC